MKVCNLVSLENAFILAWLVRCMVDILVREKPIGLRIVWRLGKCRSGLQTNTQIDGLSLDPGVN